MNNNSPIGVFDSGVGGLSVFKELINFLPNENYIYFGDTYNLPYGTKSKEELINITGNIFDFFESKNVKAVVMACNTTSAITYDVLKDKYSFKIYPIVQTVAESIANKGYSNIGIFATNATINAHAYKNEIGKYNQKVNVFETACPNWVRFVEQELQDTPECISDVKFHVEEMMKNKADKIILGCTHYPYLLNVLSKFASENIFINPAKSFAEFISNDLKKSKLEADEKLYNPVFFVSDNPAQFISASELFYKIDKAEKISLTKTLIK